MRPLAPLSLMLGALAFGAACNPSSAPPPEPSARSSASAAVAPTETTHGSNAAEPRTTAAPDRAEIGKQAPSFSLKDLDGNAVDLGSLKGKIVVLEWFNPDCPFVKLNHTKGPLRDMAKKKTEQGIVWLAVNSNAKGKQGYGADRNKDARKTYGMNYPILLDETGEVGRRYGAKTTPHMFVIDKQGTLVYAGAVDNAQDGDPPGGEAFVNYVEKALADLNAGRPVAVSSVPSYGCSVKYAN